MTSASPNEVDQEHEKTRAIRFRAGRNPARDINLLVAGIGRPFTVDFKSRREPFANRRLNAGGAKEGAMTFAREALYE